LSPAGTLGSRWAKVPLTTSSGFGEVGAIGEVADRLAA
jgi:hypothetical protein